MGRINEKYRNSQLPASSLNIIDKISVSQDQHNMHAQLYN
jgi:hypothetical protein